MLKNILEGKPCGHPIHPMLVHLPIGLFTVSFLIDLATLATEDRNLDHLLLLASYYSMIAGVITALLAAVFGFVDFTEIRNDHPAKKIAIGHMILNLLIVGMFAVNIGLRYPPAPADRAPPWGMGLSLVALALLYLSGFLGGHMIYSDGVAVGRHRRYAPTPRATLRLSGAGSPDGYVSVADFGKLEEGQSLRLDIDGTIIAVFREGEQVYAVQEFCTHRYGPLSEGRCRQGAVTCPWHRSQFSLLTGEVQHEPAKVPINTFAAEIRDGRIFVAARASPPTEQASP